MLCTNGEWGAKTPGQVQPRHSLGRGAHTTAVFLQGYLDHTKQRLTRTIQWECASRGPCGGPREGGLFLMSEVPLW